MRDISWGTGIPSKLMCGSCTILLWRWNCPKKRML